MQTSFIRFKPWKQKYFPKKVLAIRLQALGDTVITLPYLQSLKRQYPELQIHFLTRKEVCSIPKSITLFDDIITIGGRRNVKLQLLSLCLRIPYLWWQGYDVILDLQNNKVSNLLRRLLMVRTWTEFDKYSERSAGERTKNTIEALGLWKVTLNTHFQLTIDVESFLSGNNWKKDHQLVALNPAGAFPSRNWPLNHYIDFAKLWLEQINPDTQFVLLLLPSLQEKGEYISKTLNDKCINLTGKASQVEAFAILQKCAFVLSEDSGLMHMAWVQGVPTLALFSSSKKVWAAPQGEWSDCLDSSDMECGPCGLVICQYGDNRCLTRYSPRFVLDKARQLLSVKAGNI